MERFAHWIKLIGSDCQHHQPCVRTSERWQLVAIDGYCTILQALNKSQVTKPYINPKPLRKPLSIPNQPWGR